MKQLFFFIFTFCFSLTVYGGVSIKLTGKIISYSEHDIKVLSEGKIEVIPMEYVPPALKFELYKRLNKEVVIRLPEHILGKRVE